MKVPLDKPKRLAHLREFSRLLPWASCRPFVENSRAVLIHRPREVVTHKLGDKWKSHISIKCWCDNTMTGGKKFTFLDAPQEQSIVCARCEDNAVASGLMPSSSIVGRHVHTGGVVPMRRCCGGET